MGIPSHACRFTVARISASSHPTTWRSAAGAAPAPTSGSQFGCLGAAHASCNDESARLLEGLLDLIPNIKRDKHRRWVQVVLARLVDHANQIALDVPRISEDSVNASNHERCAIPSVRNANRVVRSAALSGHVQSSKTRLILNSLRATSVASYRVYLGLGFSTTLDANSSDTLELPPRSGAVDSLKAWTFANAPTYGEGLDGKVLPMISGRIPLLRPLSS